MLVDSSDNMPNPGDLKGTIVMSNVEIFEMLRKSVVAQIKALGENMSDFSLLGRNHPRKGAAANRKAA